MTDLNACHPAGMCYGTGGMIYAVGIRPSAFAKAMADRAAQGVCLRRTRRRHGSAGASPSQTTERRLRGGRGSRRAVRRWNLRQFDPEARPGKVRPSQTQSNLVAPSPTINFRGISGGNPPIRAHPCAFVAASICVHLCVSVAPAQPAFAGPTTGTYGLIRPNTALIIFENERPDDLSTLPFRPARGGVILRC